MKTRTMFQTLAATTLCWFPSAARAFAPHRSATTTTAYLLRRHRHSSSSSSSALRAESDDEYDLVVIGGGSGGVRASRIAAGYGKKVAILEPQLQHGVDPYYSAIGGTVCDTLCKLLYGQGARLLLFFSRFSHCLIFSPLSLSS